MKVFELMELLNIEGKDTNNNYSNAAAATSTAAETKEHKNLASVGSKIWNVVENKFPYSTFTSSDILEMYEDEYDEPIQLSIISVYLSRYSERGKLARSKKGKEWIYKIARQSSASQTQVHQLEHLYHQHQQQQQHHSLSHDVPLTDIN
jgi:hypothetical protein